MSDRRPINCWKCGKLMGLADECPYCGAKRNSPAGAIQRGLRVLSGGAQLQAYQIAMRLSIVVYVIGVLLTFFLAGPATGVTSIVRGFPQGILLLLGLNSPAFFGGNWWGVFTATFLHIGILHLIFNLYALHILGPLVENVLGRVHIWNLFLLSGVGGAFLTALMGNAAAGASTGVFGLIGAGIVVSFFLGDGVDDPMFRQLVLWAGITFAIGIFSGLPMDNWGHFGGLVSGMILAYLWTLLRRRRTFEKWSGWLARILTGGLLVAYGACLFHFLPLLFQ